MLPLLSRISTLISSYEREMMGKEGVSERVQSVGDRQISVMTTTYIFPYQ